MTRAALDVELPTAHSGGYACGGCSQKNITERVVRAGVRATLPTLRGGESLD